MAPLSDFPTSSPGIEAVPAPEGLCRILLKFCQRRANTPDPFWRDAIGGEATIELKNRIRQNQPKIKWILSWTAAFLLCSLNFHKFPKKSPEMGQSSMRASQGPASSSQVVNHVSQVSPALESWRNCDFGEPSEKWKLGQVTRSRSDCGTSPPQAVLPTTWRLGITKKAVLYFKSSKSAWCVLNVFASSCFFHSSILDVHFPNLQTLPSP